MRFTYVTLLVMVLLQACGTVVDVELPGHKPRLVLNSFFTPDSLWSINLSSSQHILEGGAYKDISDAQVILLSQGRELEKLIYMGSGNYKSSSNSPAPGTLYTIRVNAPEFDPVESSNQVPSKPVISSITLDTTRFNFYEGEYKVNFSFQDEAAKENYYTLTLLAYDANAANARPEILDIFTDEPYIGSLTPRRGKRGISFSDKHFADQEISFGVYIPRRVIDSHNVVVAVLKNISAEYYHYEVTLQNQLELQSNPFKEPAAIYSNIVNGFGIFAGYQADADTLKY